ncbi:MAG: hypothetical protein KAT34_09815 [Candidatus Aminicenantes bacterium]|nr:hypothetical protein [Candidatus Aminicenantes bacterium]
MNYFKDFLDMIEDDILDRLVRNTPGSEEAEAAIREFNTLIEKDQKRDNFDEKFTQCLALHQELWFNIGWSAGWTAGAIVILQMAGFDLPSKKVTQNLNLDPD